MIKIIKFILIPAFSLMLIYGSFLSYPSFLYSYEEKNENVTIYCDQEFPSNITAISDSVLERIKKSEFYDENSEYSVYISNKKINWLLVSNFHSHAGALHHMWFRGNSFVRPSVIEENRITTTGSALGDAEERDLIYFISHEITHEMMARSIGYFNFQFHTQAWIREGYADLIGKKSFNYDSSFEQLINNEHRLSEASGLYVRYHVLLLYLLNNEKHTLANIINENYPQEYVIEKIKSKW